MAGFLGTGMIVDDFRQAGTTACDRERWKMLVKTRESWSAHVLSTFPGTPSGLVAFLEFTALSTCLTSCSATVSGGWGAGRWCWSRLRFTGRVLLCLKACKDAV